ncbi:pentapeptide repeat-containing protein [Bifidobacterium angulatum]|uniref:pentapeptide repeat-containing protein n=3 Tax=Bifidobacterium angulatum TaxID=1683 RepID=UPI0034A54E44
MAEESGKPSDGMTQPSREKPQWGKKLSQKCKAAWRRCKDSLFGAIAIWAVLGIIAFVLAMWGLGRVPVWQLKLDPEKQAESIVKIALTLVGGVGAVAYLVIKYQEQQQAGRAEKREKDRIVDTKMQDAINQLGSDKASTRIAGVYALADIADTYRGGYRQRVVDILCGYLRSDRETYPLGEDGKPATGLPRSGDADKAVESTILSMFVAHLKKGPRDENGDVTLRQQVRNDQLWCDCSFDLHGATFHEDVRLIGTTFEHGLNFQGTKFERGANFSGAHFTGGASFSGAHFTGGASFSGAHFTGDADFLMAHFTGGANFSGAHFTGGANFNVADLDGANFSGAHFTGGANFVMAEFRTSAVFSGIQGQPSFRFEECKFNKIFRGAYEWGPIPIPEDNDGLPAGAVWKDFLEEALKDKDFLELWRNLNKCLKEYGKDGGTTNR